MATYNKFNCFVQDIAQGVHNLATGQLVVALCNSANAPVATNNTLSNLTTIAYTNLSTRNITTVSCTQVAGTLSLILTDLVLTASGTVAPFRYVVIYNDSSASDSLICWFDYGSDLTLNNTETLTIDFDVTGLLTII